MKKSRRWKASEVKRLMVTTEPGAGPAQLLVGEPPRPLADGPAVEIRTSYPPSANHSRKFHSRKLTDPAMEYQKSIGWLYRAAGGKRHEGPVAMEVELYKPAVKVPYDIDNALMNIFNGLKGIAYRDDDQVTLLTVAKMWPDGAGRAVIRLKKIAPAKAAGA